MTKSNEQDIVRIELTADQKQTVEAATTDNAEASEGPQELKGEELEERIAPSGGFNFTRPTDASSL